MGLAKTVTRMFPTENRIGINFTLTDNDRPDLGPGAQVVVAAVISRNYVKGQDIPNELRDEIGREAQALIDRYKDLRGDYDKPAYQTKVNQIDGALTL